MRLAYSLTYDDPPAHPFTSCSSTLPPFRSLPIHAPTPSLPLDPFPHADQLIVHGVGDCGVILLRDTVLDRVGSLLRGGTASGIRGGWRVSARATQQLKAFNQPYQLGFAPGQEGRFETPWQGETLVLPVQPGDLVIAASDG